MNKGQSKRASLMEALVNTAIGLVISLLATYTITRAHSIPMTWAHNAIITFWMTLISVARSYVVRRMWDVEFWKRL